MSLIVIPYTRDPDSGEMQSLYSRLDPGKDLAGFEVYRQTFWGANIMLELGLTELPKLREYDVMFENEGLDILEKEAQTILTNAALIAQETAPDAAHVEMYARNILHSLNIAREVNGGVYIG